MRLSILLLGLLVLAGVLVPLVVRAQSSRVTRARQKAELARHPQLAPYQTEKFYLSAGPGVPEGYPARIMAGRFLNSSGGGFPLPYGHLLEGDWGLSGIGWVVGDPMQAVPDSLELRWFSYTDDKFYEGHFPLPQEKIYHLLKQGFWDREAKRHYTYESFTVCVLPTGGVVVWLDGLRKLVVGRFQAQQIQYDFLRFNDGASRAAIIAQRQGPLPAAVKAEIKAGTLSTKKWDAYLKRYPWKLEFNRSLTLFNHGIIYYSAEKSSFPLRADGVGFAEEVLGPSPKPIPEFVMLYVAGADGRKRLLKVDPFDEAETMGAFQMLAAKHPGQPITLHVEVDEELKKATLSLRAGGQVLPLTKSTIQFFDLP